MKHRYLFLLAFAVAYPAAAAQPDTDDALPRWQPKVRTLTVFKNGLGFVVKSGNTPLRDGWARMDGVPAAALGSLWIGSRTPGHVPEEIIAMHDEQVEEVEALTQEALLAANVGRVITITYATGATTRTVEGKLLSAAIERPPSTRTTPGFAGAALSLEPLAAPQRPEVILLETQSGGRPAVLSLQRSAIVSVEFPPEAVRKSEVRRDVTAAKIRVGDRPAASDLTMMYLTRGIVWSPSYRLELSGSNTADLVLHAVLATDSEDLEDAEVGLVVGYPHFLHADTVTPLSVGQSVAQFIQALMTAPGPGRAAGLGNVLAQSIAFNTANFDASARTAASALGSVPGEASEDLYIYRKRGITLRKGERLQTVLLAAQVPCEHRYQWEVPDRQTVDDHSRPRDASPPETQELVWHVLRLENTTRQPWTTAPAFTLKDNEPLAQDTLRYTPPGAKNLLKLTVATDVRAEQSLVETRRNRLTLDGRAYDDITVRGTLKVTNWRPATIRCGVRKMLSGEVLNAGEGAVTKHAKALAALNPTSELEWEFSLAPGKARDLVYEYHLLVYR